jgi:nucleotide-binding universal stress UspA family protein
MHKQGRVVIAYDGSAGAEYAIEQAAKYLGHRRAHVVYARPPSEAPDGHLRSSEHIEAVPLDRAADDDSALALARTGADLAQRAGFDATAEVVSGEGDTAGDIIEAADDLDADLIVIGSRGHDGAGSTQLGSVSHALLHRARRPVLTISAPELARRRQKRDRQTADRR